MARLSAAGWSRAFRTTVLGVTVLGVLAPTIGAAQPGSADPATQALCRDLRVIEQAALADFAPLQSAPRLFLHRFKLGPRAYDATLILPEAQDCYLGAALQPGRLSYRCVWRSSDAAYAAPDFARRIARCFDNAPIRQSTFSSQLIVTTLSLVRFEVGGDSDQVRLVVQTTP